jgi:hypothetical protein
MIPAMRRGTRLAIAFTVVVAAECVLASSARAQYGDLEEAARILPRLLGWAGPTGRTTVFDLACRAIPVTRHERELNGETPTRGTRYAPQGISFSVFVQLTEIGQHGRAAALGLLMVVQAALSKVTRDAAWYGSEHPLIFRSRAACQDYRRKHRVAEDDLLIWPAFLVPP